MWEPETVIKALLIKNTLLIWIVLGTTHIFTHIFLVTLLGRYYNPYFTKKETEAEAKRVTSLSLPSW